MDTVNCRIHANSYAECIGRCWRFIAVIEKTQKEPISARWHCVGLQWKRGFSSTDDHQTAACPSDPQFLLQIVQYNTVARPNTN